MKPVLKYSPILLSLLSAASFAANPVNGWYAGIILGGSYAPKANFTIPVPATLNTTICSAFGGCPTGINGSLSFDGYGNIGGQIGIRTNQLRFEFEPLVNYNPYDKLTIGPITLESPKSSDGLRMKGDTTTAALMVNGFYDFYRSDCNLVPYVGAGLGVAYVNNNFRLLFNNQTLQITKVKEHQTTAAVQGIVGASYFMDDYTWFGLDYRYITTQNIDILDNRVQIHTVNLSFSGMFNCF